MRDSSFSEGYRMGLRIGVLKLTRMLLTEEPATDVIAELIEMHDENAEAWAVERLLDVPGMRTELDRMHAAIEAKR